MPANDEISIKKGYYIYVSLLYPSTFSGLRQGFSLAGLVENIINLPSKAK